MWNDNDSIVAGGDIWRCCFVIVIIFLSFFMIQRPWFGGWS
jgi:hypothetical protein